MTYSKASTIFVVCVTLFMANNVSAAETSNSCSEMLSYTGAPEHGGSVQNQDVLCRTGYVLSHNKERRVADWVLEVLTVSRTVGTATRKRSRFSGDPDLSAADRSEPVDYARSGYDQGHMAPAADMKWDQAAMDESFYLSNMAPQVGAGFNRGIWRQLEEYVRDLIYEREPIVVITGPIYTDSDKLMVAKNRDHVSRTTDVTIPAHFYKIIFDPDRKRAIAFKLPNKKLKGGIDELRKYRVTIDEIEDDTGLDFLTSLSQRDQRRIEKTRSEFWRAYEP